MKLGRTRWAGHVSHTGEMRNVYKMFIGKPERKRPLQIHRRRWEDNIKMRFTEIECDHGAWIHLAQDWGHWRNFLSTVMNLR
jgi:hypothetical protein